MNHRETKIFSFEPVLNIKEYILNANLILELAYPCICPTNGKQILHSLICLLIWLWYFQVLLWLAICSKIKLTLYFIWLTMHSLGKCKYTSSYTHNMKNPFHFHCSLFNCFLFVCLFVCLFLIGPAHFHFAIFYFSFYISFLNP